MANRSGRSVSFTPFRPQGVLAEGQLAVARPGGEALAGAAASFGTLARSLGGMADSLAAAEGERAGLAAGNDPSFRPGRRGTIRGRAHDKAAIETYLNNLDARLRLDMQDVFEAHRDDPAGLRGAFDGLAEKFRRDDVFPEIAGAFEAQFARLRLPFQNRSLDNAESERRARDYGELVRTVNELDTARSRQLAALDPNDPAAVDALIGTQNAIETQYDRAVERGLMEPAAAEKAKIEDRREAAVGFYGRQAEALRTPQEVAEFRETLREAHAAGRLDGVDGEGFDVLDGALARLQERRATEGRTASSALRRQIDSYVARVGDGVSPPTAEWSRLRLEAGQVPDGEALVQIARAKLVYAKIIRDRPLAEAEQAVARLRRETETAEDKEVLDFAEARLAAERNLVAGDTIGAGERRGLIETPSPLVLQRGQSAEDVAGQVAARVAQADAVAEQLGRPARYLRPGEAALIRDMAAADPETAVALAGGLVAGAGPRAGRLLSELGDDAPALAQAGAILAAGGAASAARDALIGARAPEGGGKRVDMPLETRAEVARSELGNAFAVQPEDGIRVKETARNITRTRLEAAGIDPGEDTDRAQATFTRALKEATGAVFVDGEQYGGIADYPDPAAWSPWAKAKKAVAPPGVRAGAFADVVRAIRDEDLAGLAVPPRAEDGTPYRARDLHAALPVAVAGGWRFALGDPASDDPRWIRGADGRPFTLDITTLLPRLRARVPGAFLGE